MDDQDIVIEKEANIALLFYMLEIKKSEYFSVFIRSYRITYCKDQEHICF